MTFSQTSRRKPARARLDLEALEDRVVLNAHLVDDLNPLTESAFAPGAVEMARVGSILYFTADDGLHPNALWRSDGTARGTKLVKSIGDPALLPGSNSTIAHLTPFGSQVIFTANDGTSGDEVWISDGTEAGTRLLRDINPGRGEFGDPEIPDGAAADRFTVVDNRCFFVASDGVNGSELWVTDGTTAGTRLVRVIDPGNTPGTGGPAQMAAFQGKLYFTVDDGEHGLELWVSDGTSAGTRLVKDINPGPDWGMDPATTDRLVVAGNRLFFAADDGINGVELWVSDGTESGTRRVEDINPEAEDVPPDSSFPRELTAVGERVFFVADGGQGDGPRVWISDGTARGTHRIEAVPAGNPRQLLTAGSRIYFLAEASTGGVDLWVTDGTEEGTRSLKNVLPGAEIVAAVMPPGGSSVAMTAVGETVYFVAEIPGQGRELWKTDGSEAGTVQVADIRRGRGGSGIAFAGELRGKVYFAASNGTHGRELWASDGTARGTRLVKDINTTGVGASVQVLATIGTTTFFVANDGRRGDELWKTDGTAEGTRLIRDINRTWLQGYGWGDSIPAGSGIRDAVVNNGILYFVADDGLHGEELWRSDGTASGTRMVRDLNQKEPYSSTSSSTPKTRGSSPGNLTVFAGKLLFTADDGLHGRELWISDGTSRGTRLVRDINPTIGPSDDLKPGENRGSDPTSLTVLAGRLFFSADDGHHGRELWVSDGSAAGTAMVVDIFPGSSGKANSSGPDQLTAVGSRLFFTADDGQHGRELWASDGSAGGTRLVRDINRSGPRASPGNLTARGDTLFFTADDGVNGPALWISNGTTRGTRMIRDFEPPPPTYSVSIRDLTVAEDLVFFAVTELHGDELWVSDGTRAGTRLVKDIYPGSRSSAEEPWDALPNSSAPVRLGVAGGLFYFTAEDGKHGRELWVSDGSAAGTVLVQDIRPGSPSGLDWYTRLVVSGNAAYFGANDGSHGQELWRLTL